jgi:hypothetical protein
VTDKAKVQQLAGRIVDKNEQAGFLAALFEPAMIRTIDLHQFAPAFTTLA